MRLLAVPTILVTLVVSMAGELSAGPVFTLPTPVDFRNSSWSFGEIFTVGPQDLLVTALGAYDAALDGYVTQGGIPVGIFRESDDVLLTSTTVLSTDPLVDNFRYASIAPLTLFSGVSYRVVAVNRDDLYNISPVFIVSPVITRTGYGYCNTTALTSCDDFTGAQVIWMANFQTEQAVEAIPEPASLVLFGSGVTAIVMRARGRKRQTGTMGN